jgi:MFS transporter, LPLT family, lysophospholipid transporter
VQNFNENLSILVMLGAYALMLRGDLSIQTIIVLFGLFVAITMYVIYRKHRHDEVL